MTKPTHRLVRYCDDFVILHKALGDRVQFSVFEYIITEQIFDDLRRAVA